ncbi:DUF5681 domain-containing protein [Brevundimonas sp.]|uniref:DUF5681 domain-containing protein n=1 Tax=Brevundimonas sp. TaxID=1871086 RepID=UPI00261CBB3F|nr:DUF5681 domain-containing protein [Brevundimonas sp.]
MSDDDDAVGYCKPPKGSQWKKGQSGNLKGRPKLEKAERALSSRQLIRDIIEALEKPVTVRTPSGAVKMTASQALIAQATQKALSGDRISARFLLKQYAAALDELEKDRSPTLMFRELETYERKAASGGLPPDELRLLGILRKHSRTIV